jgi:hypothetical protein
LSRDKTESRIVLAMRRAEYDLRGAFALCHALTSVIKGVASLANDQLDECLQRCWQVRHATWHVACNAAAETIDGPRVAICSTPKPP